MPNQHLNSPWSTHRLNLSVHRADAYENIAMGLCYGGNTDRSLERLSYPSRISHKIATGHRKLQSHVLVSFRAVALLGYFHIGPLASPVRTTPGEKHLVALNCLFLVRGIRMYIHPARYSWAADNVTGCHCFA